MNGISLWKALVLVIIIALLPTLFSSPALATVPQQADGGHSSSGTGNCRNENDPDWRDLTNNRFLPEGYTGYTSNWIALLNLHNAAQNANINCRDEYGNSWTTVKALGALSSSSCRGSVNLNTFVPSGKSVCTKVSVPQGRIVAERSTYKGLEGTCSSGSGSPRTGVYLAEGYTGHDVYISIYNPYSTTTMKFIFYIEGVAGKKLYSKTVSAGKVAVVHVNDLAWAKTYPNHSFSFEVNSENGAQFAVERSSYFN